MATPDRDAPDPAEARLDDLERGIQEARRQAEEHGTIAPEEPSPTFVDPDADGRVDDEDEDPGATFAT